MATLTIPITVEQIRELARQLSPQERQTLLDTLLAERYDAVMTQSDRQRASQQQPGAHALSEEQIQSEIDAVRQQRREAREGRPRATGG